VRGGCLSRGAHISMPCERACGPGRTRAAQEFVEILQAATAGAGCRLLPAPAPLAEFALPPRFSLLHAAVLYSSLSAAFLSRS